jgi:iron complex outermembrane receptor protein
MRILVVAQAGLCALLLMGNSVSAQILEEITVTAQKREQSAQDVGISLTAVSGDLMKNLGVETVNDLSDFVPNLKIQNQFGGDQAVFDIRGVALFSYDSANSAPVATYVDGVVLPYPAMTQGQLFDVDRVEVLRGPQGTLFGKNTTGGAVSFVTKNPGEETEGFVRAEYGDYDYLRLEAAAGGSLSDSFAVRIAGMTIQQDEGYQRDVFSGQDVGDIDRAAARLTFAWTPTDSFDANLKLRMGRDKSKNQGLKILAPYAQTFGGDPDPDNWLVFTPADHPGHWDTGVGANMFADINPFDVPRKDNKSSGATLTMNWGIGENTLTSVTGYDKLDRTNQMDWDGTPFPTNDYSFSGEMKSLSQEIRLAGANDRLTWMVGAYFAKDEVNEKARYDCSVSDICFLVAYGVDYLQESSTAAAFAHTEWSLTDSLSLTAGIRYTEEDRELKNIGTTLDSDPFDVFGGLFGYPVGDQSLTGHLADDFSSASGILDCLVLGNCPGYAPRSDWQLKDDAVSGKLGLNWFANDDVLLFTSISRGFKSGGFGSFPASQLAQYQPYDSETLTAYEAGMKSTLADGKVQLNLGLYYYDYEDRQVFSGLHDVVFGPLSAYVNAPKSSMSGAEVELNWAPAAGWDIRQAIGVASGEFDEFVDYDAAAVNAAGPDPVSGLFETPIFRDRAGEDAPGTDLQYSGLVAYRFGLSSSIDMRVQFDYSYSSEYTSIYGSAFELPEYWLYNAQVSLLKSESDTWEVALWARNLGNEKYFTDKNFYNEAQVQGAVGAPRTWGIRFNYNWN